MPVTIEEAKSFITSAHQVKQNWQTMAKRSWDEIKKRQVNGKLWSVTPNSTRKKARYPAWYSIFKIRQSLVLSRVGIPVCKDTTQDGSDNVGATAAIIRERLAVSLAKSFPFLEVMAASRDDFLATNFALCRGYYERKTIKEKIKEYLQPQKEVDETGQEVAVFYDASGKVISEGDIRQDDEGFFIYHDKVIDVEDEKICLEPLIYKDVYVDPDIKRWTRCKRLAFECHYSEPEFKTLFGSEAYADLASPEDTSPQDEAAPKLQRIKVFEYWDYYDREVYWFAENGSQFIKPRNAYLPEDPDDADDYLGEDLNGLYNLDAFFPCPPPLIMNAPTDEFWPIPEYYQLVEIIDEIHQIFSRMIETTRAYRARLLFDSSIDGLQEAINEMPETGAIGVSNLTQSLVAAGGDLKSVAQYIPVDGIIKSLEQLYQSLEQRLNVIYKLTGTSDLLQGLITDPTQRTFGERQMTEKYALNQLEEPQRKMAEYVRDCYELLTEMALKNFKDSSLDMYIMPATLQPQDKDRYRQALGMLKDNQKRFRIELETDSTIALNEEYDKEMRIELVNTLTKALEATANIAQQSPALVGVELHALKFLIQGFRQGKVFQSEITEAIDNVIKMNAEAAAKEPAPFNKDEAMAKFKMDELNANNQLTIAQMQIRERTEMAKIQSQESIEMAQLQQTERIAGLKAQIETFKLQSEQGTAATEIQIQYEKLSSDIQLRMDELAIERDKNFIKMREIGDAKEAEQFRIMFESRALQLEESLAASQQMLDESYMQLDMKERFMTEQRLQSEHQLQKIEVMAKAMQKPPEPAKTINVEAAKPSEHTVIRDPNGNIIQVKSGSKISKIERDAMGNITKVVTAKEGKE